VNQEVRRRNTPGNEREVGQHFGQRLLWDVAERRAFRERYDDTGVFSATACQRELRHIKSPGDKGVAQDAITGNSPR